jgi:hypothetical protein
VGVAAIAVAVLGMETFATAATFTRRFEPVYAPGGRAAGYRLFYYDEKWAAFDDAVAWLDARLQSNGDASAVVATSAPHRAYLNTRAKRKAVMPPMEADPAKSQELLDSASVKYVIIDELGFLDIVKRYTRPTIEANPGRWERIYTVPGTDTHVYRRTGGQGGST